MAFPGGFCYFDDSPVCEMNFYVIVGTTMRRRVCSLSRMTIPKYLGWDIATQRDM